MPLLVMVLVLVASVDATAAGDKFKGGLVSDALHALRTAGLRIVFSSEIVTPDLRVAVEPRSKAPREILEEILRPHGLTVERGPDGVLIVVRAPGPTRRDPPKVLPRTERPHEPPRISSQPGYVEEVLVVADSVDAARSAVGAEISLGRDELDGVPGSLGDDPVRALQSLPRVVAADDFQSEFSVRGSSRRHIGIVIDGVATPWLRHAAYGRGDLGSLTMLGTDVLGQATLLAGAYPQYDGDWLGAQLSVTLREGSRTDTRVQASTSGINGSFVVEGPLGREPRGSWLVAARQSYLDWPLKRRNALDASVFGFSDALAKLVYDVHANHKLSVTAIAGRTGIDGPDEGGAWELANGTNTAGLLTARWDATLSRSFRVSQQLHVLAHRFHNSYQNGHHATQGAESDLSYRIHLSRPLAGGLLELGGQAKRAETFVSPAESRTVAFYRSGYLSFGWSPNPHLTLWPGLRLSTSSVGSRPALGRWLLGQWRILDGWTLNASAGVSHQFPELSWTADDKFSRELTPERAIHTEIALAHRAGQSIRWQASLFRRSERDVFPSVDTAFDPIEPVRFRSRLIGQSSGIELLVERRASRGLSGWAGYSFGRSHYADESSGGTFRAEFDRRHSINAAARYSFSHGTTAAATFRAGSSLPDLRFAPYARLDFRAERTFEIAGHRVAIFGEIINVLNRRSLVRGNSTVHDETDATVLTERLLPRMPLAGFRVEF
jgi:hypothetical protein